jgi:hypothetical protein
MEATTTETNPKCCAPGSSDPGRGSVDLPVLEARPLRVAGASSVLPDDHGSTPAVPSIGPSATGSGPARIDRIASATSRCEKFALSDGFQIVLATIQAFDDVDAPAPATETGIAPISLQRYQCR